MLVPSETLHKEKKIKTPTYTLDQLSAHFPNWYEHCFCFFYHNWYWGEFTKV